MMKKKIESLKIYGKRWFQKSCGNTYHSVTIIVNGIELYVGCSYGYGNHYLQTTLEALQDEYDIPTEYGEFLKFLHDNNFTYSVTDVNRKKDL